MHKSHSHRSDSVSDSGPEKETPLVNHFCHGCHGLMTVQDATNNLGTMARRITGDKVVERPPTTSQMRGDGSRRCSVSIWFLIVSNLLIFQLTFCHRKLFSEGSFSEMFSPRQQQLHGSPSDSYILDFPRGPAVALPSVRSEQEMEKTDRKHYGGEGDKKHLGGFTDIDLHGISPALWKHMITYFGIKTLLDVGCGRGISTSWFALHGVDAHCVEGSHDAVSKSILPDPANQVVEHDFSRGPWWPTQTVDAVWCVEFLEHVGRNFHHNYLPAFRKAALIFMTHSQWGGW